LRNVSLVFDGGGLMVLGPNGAGKSTLMNTILGFLKPISGECYVLGRRCEENALRGFSDLVAASEKPNIVRGSIEDFLEYVSTFRGCSWSKFYDYVERFNLKREYLRRDFRKLSAGEKMKLYISVVLSVDAKLYVLDEPNSNLDVDSRRVLGEMIFEKLREGGNIVMTTHIYEEYTTDVATHILILNRGEVVVHGRTDELMKRYVGKMCLATVRPQKVDEFAAEAGRRGIEFRRLVGTTFLIYDCTKLHEIGGLSDLVVNVKFASIETLYKALIGGEKA